MFEIYDQILLFSKIIFHHADRTNELTQKCAKMLTLNDRSIMESGVSSNGRPETTPALFIRMVT